MEERPDPLEEEDLTEEEIEAAEAVATILSDEDEDFLEKLLDRLMALADKVAGHPLRAYQKPAARRMFESMVIDDGEIITALFSRQSGKTELVAAVVVVAMIFFPRLAKIWPIWFDKFKDGVSIGVFAPVDYQATIIYNRIVYMLSSPSTKELLADPEINDRVMNKAGAHFLVNCRSRVTKTTMNPRATIEGETYHLIVIDEAQGADAQVMAKSVSPMGTAYNASTLMTGTPWYTTGIFYKIIQKNRRKMVAKNRGKIRQNHFQVDWREVVKVNKYYKKSVQKAMDTYGADSDEFKLSYKVMWLLDQGMFTTAEALEEMGDVSMQSCVKEWHDTPVVVGIDVGRKQDKTVVTVVWVNWDRTDSMGFHEHRILDWLDLSGVDWEEQYFRIREFLSNYKVWKVGIDVNGLGDTVCQRLKLLMPNTEFVELGADQTAQSERWKYLKELLEHRIDGEYPTMMYPAGAKVKKLKKHKRFIQEMEDLQLIFKGPHVLAEAPQTKDAHDDYPDSLAMACILTKEEKDNDESVEQYQNMFYKSLKKARNARRGIRSR